MTRPMCLNLEHYYARDARGGRFVPRYQAPVREARLDLHRVRVDIAPCGDWQVAAAITYELQPGRVVQAAFEFEFLAPYRDFEAFISHYFPFPDEPLLRLGGQWVRPTLGPREHRYWPRSPGDAAAIGDGRLDEFLAELKEPYEVPVDPRCYDEPVMITTIPGSDWSVVHAAERHCCPSLSANRTWHAHDFSLVGRDVAAGERVVCRAWMAYVKLTSPDAALELYREWTAGAGSRPAVA